MIYVRYEAGKCSGAVPGDLDFASRRCPARFYPCCGCRLIAWLHIAGLDIIWCEQRVDEIVAQFGHVLQFAHADCDESQ